MGSNEAKQRWLEDKVETWVVGVKSLAVFARLFPRIAYAGLTMLLWKECQFVKHVTPDVGPLFVPLEATFREDFIPYLVGGMIEEVIESLRGRIA